MLSEVKGLVLRTTELNETDRMLTVYTAERGIISAMAKGSRSLKSRKMAASGQFCYSSFVIFERGDKLWVREAELIESFYGLRESIETLALAGYVVEVISDVATAEADPDLLRLTLNTLYAISSGRYNLDVVKGAFEMRLASDLGFMPSVLGCHSCDCKCGDFYFDIMAGALQCFACHKRAEGSHTTLNLDHESRIVRLVSEGARVAMCYAIYSPLEKLFSFSLEGEDMNLFSSAAEAYLLNHLERGFRSLDFYNEVKNK